MGETSNSLLIPEGRNRLRIGTVNANSIKGKRAELIVLVELKWTSSSYLRPSFLLPQSSRRAKRPQPRKLYYFKDIAFNPYGVLPKTFEGSIHRLRSLDGDGVMVDIRRDIVTKEVSLP